MDHLSLFLWHCLKGNLEAAEQVLYDLLLYDETLWPAFDLAINTIVRQSAKHRIQPYLYLYLYRLSYELIKESYIL